MVWNSIWPDGSKSVKQNTTPGQQNTTYTETTQNLDHFWNIGADEDGYHRRVSMESYADTAIGAPADAPIPTGMDGVFYLKPANGRIQGFYRNAQGIYQFVPSFISGSANITSSYQNIVALPNDSYGQIFFFKQNGDQAMSSGYFKAAGGVCQAYFIPQVIGNSSSTTFPMRYGNGDQVSGLNLRVENFGWRNGRLSVSNHLLGDVMDIYEVTGYSEGIDKAGVNFLSPLDSFEVLRNAFIYRQILQSRLGFVQFANRLTREVGPSTLTQQTTAGTQTIIADVLNDTGLQTPSIRSTEPNALIQAGSVVISVDSGAATWNDATTPGVLTATGGTAAAGTINYTTGQIVLNFTGAVAGGLDIEVTLVYAPGLRVMGIFENVLPDSTKDLLVIDKNYFYIYNAGTDEFDAVPFTSADPIITFGIVANEDYVSGTTYLTKTGSQRFVFTGKGMDDVYFFDGMGVKRFTNLTDNPDYQAPAAGALTKATTVLWFGERLNLFVPVIGGVTYNQGVLYSGIRDAAGNGDKFNVPGSGILSCDTYELMKSAIILGDIIIMNLQRSRWALEKTRDAFNPYFTRKIPSVLGTDAGFSAVSWNYEVKSAGKTGMLTTDGRQDLRFDNKIPYLTSDNMDQAEFELAYGGFDRINGQFLFAYRDTLSNLAPITQDKVLTYNYEERTWSINDQRFSVFGQTDKGKDLTWNDIDETQNPAWARMDETEEVWNKIGIQATIQKTLAGDDLGFVYQINADYDDYFVSITNITQAAAAVVTVEESAFQVGDRVIFVNVNGMTQINSMIGTVTAATVTNITVDIDSRNFDAYIDGGTISKLIDFEAQMIPFNPYRNQGRRIFMSHCEFQINTNGGNMFVDIYADEEEAPFKTALVVSPMATTKKRVWVDVAVDQEAEYLTLVMRHESAGFQTIVTSVRMYCQPGGYTSS